MAILRTNKAFHIGHIIYHIYALYTSLFGSNYILIDYFLGTIKFKIV